MNVAEKKKLEKVPPSIDNIEILQLVNSQGSVVIYFRILKQITNGDDKKLAAWLEISEKTFRNYKSTIEVTRSSLKEHLIMLIALFKHGLKIFGTSDQFNKWLEKGNFHFNQKPPIDFINTASGMKLIDDRLTGIEYGDNA